jgi:alpha-methylacyl-CoA racemase
MGPLQGIKIIEIAGLGPGPFAAMLLADMGAEVICVERIGGGTLNLIPRYDFASRNKRRIALDLKNPEGIAVVKKLIADADGLLEGFRPGVMEKLGLGPDTCLEINPKLVYCRITGWGQTGQLAQRAGHDINYIAMAGSLFPIGRKGEKPVIPLNIIGDYAGGSQLAAYGMVCALFSAARTGQGQVIDSAMIDGAAQLYSTMFSFQQIGFWKEERGSNSIDGGAPFYDVYETADKRYVAIGSVEPQFYAILLQKLGLDASSLPDQWDESRWDEMKARFTAVFLSKTRDEWCTIFGNSDACFAPVLSMAEALEHPDNLTRDMFIEIDGVKQPAPFPRFSLTPLRIRHGARASGADTVAVLQQCGYSDAETERLLANRVVAKENVAQE